MKTIFSFSFLMLLGVRGAITKCEKTVTTTSGSKAPNEKKLCSGDLIFEETFDGTFDLDNVWQHDISFNGNGKMEFQWYSNNRSTSFVEDGKLNIRPALTTDDYGEHFLYTGTLDLHGSSPKEQRCTNAANSGCLRTGSYESILNPIKTARVETLNSFAFKYGKVEINAKVPSGDWLSSSIKFLPKSNAYGSWPASGEIDLMQSRGNRELIQNGINIGVDQITSYLQYGPYSDANVWQSFARNLNDKGKGFNSGFHRYQMEWATDKITFSVDDIETATVKAKSGFWEKGDFDTKIPATYNPWIGSKMAPFDQEFYLVIDLAVGGEHFPEDAFNGVGDKPWTNSSRYPATEFWHAKNLWLPTWKINENRTKEASFLIDYVRVWAL